MLLELYPVIMEVEREGMTTYCYKACRIHCVSETCKE